MSNGNQPDTPPEPQAVHPPAPQAPNLPQGQAGAADVRAAIVQNEAPSPYVQGSEFALWDKYEQIAMHFNDLIMRLRTQALGGLTAVIAISGAVLNLSAKPEFKVEWQILFGTLCFFTIAWTALWVLDFCYYTPLLQGAVKAIVKHEGRTPSLIADGASKRINLSTIVQDAVPHFKVTIFFFYLIVWVALCLGTIYAAMQIKGAATAPAAPQQPLAASNVPGGREPPANGRNHISEGLIT
jgi:hypothetical protein